MLGKTHLVVGIAATMAVTQPKKLSEVILAVGLGGVGAMISDIDVSTSHSHRRANQMTWIAGVFFVGILLVDYFYQVNMMKQMITNRNYGRIIVGVLGFIAVCAFGKEQPHRSFMHSFLALALLCLALALIWKKMVPYFAVGFLSHLIIDSFNKKKVRIFYPLKGGISLGLCCAKGLANQIFFTVGSALVVYELVVSAGRILTS